MFSCQTESEWGVEVILNNTLLPPSWETILYTAQKSSKDRYSCRTDLNNNLFPLEINPFPHISNTQSMRPFSHICPGSGPQLGLGYTCHEATEVSELQTWCFWERCLLVPDNQLGLPENSYTPATTPFYPHCARTDSLATCSFSFSSCKSHFQVIHHTTQNSLMHTSQEFYKS